jgi:hypothetical protein
MGHRRAAAGRENRIAGARRRRNGGGGAEALWSGDALACSVLAQGAN